MTTTPVATATARSQAPADYTELFTVYYDYVTHLVKRAGIFPDNSEDVAMTILTKFFEKSVLEDFDPEHTTNHAGVTRKAVFRTFLSGFVLSYVRHYRDRQQVDAYREPKIINSEFTAPDGTYGTWADVYGTPTTETYEVLYEEDFINTVRRHLRSLPPPNSPRAPLPDVFEAALKQANETGEVHVPTLAAQFNVSTNTIYVRLSRLKAEVKFVAEQ